MQHCYTTKVNSLGLNRSYLLFCTVRILCINRVLNETLIPDFNLERTNSFFFSASISIFKDTASGAGVSTVTSNQPWTQYISWNYEEWIWLKAKDLSFLPKWEVILDVTSATWFTFSDVTRFCLNIGNTDIPYLKQKIVFLGFFMITALMTNSEVRKEYKISWPQWT